MFNNQSLNHHSPNISEQEIVSLLQQRNIRGVDALYTQYGNTIFGLVYSILKQDTLAELVLQDTFLKVWNKIDSFSLQKGRFIFWLMNIARNTAIDMLRSKNYKQTLKLISFENLPANANVTRSDVQIENIDMRDIVAKMDDKYSTIIQLIYFEGYTHAEVAEALNLPLGTVKGRVRRAFKELRLIFEA